MRIDVESNTLTTKYSSSTIDMATLVHSFDCRKNDLYNVFVVQASFDYLVVNKQDGCDNSNRECFFF